MNPEIEILQKIVEYKDRPSLSKMWEIWLYCDKHDITLPGEIRDRLRKYAESKVKDNRQADLKAATDRFIHFLFDEYIGEGMSEVKAAELIAEQDISINGEIINASDALNASSILRNYQRSKK